MEKLKLDKLAFGHYTEHGVEIAAKVNELISWANKIDHLIDAILAVQDEQEKRNERVEEALLSLAAKVENGVWQSSITEISEILKGE